MATRYDAVGVDSPRHANFDTEKPTFSYHDEEKGGLYDETDESPQFAPLNGVSTRVRSFAESQYSHYQTLSRQNRLWRYLAPCCLIVSIILFFVLCGLPGTSSLSASPLAPVINPSVNSKLATEPLTCPDHYHAHRIAKDDSCWDIATIKGTSVDGLLKVNPGLDCEKLEIGGEVCVPGIPESSVVISKLHVIGENMDEADFV